MRRVRFLLIVLLSGCYRYAAVTEPALAPGSHVRLALDESNAASLRRVLGEETIAVEGRVVGASDSVYTLAVEATLKRGMVAGAPRRTVWAGEAVTIPRAAIRQSELRSLDRGRTTRALALATAAAVLTVKLIVSAVGSSSGGDDGGIIVTPP